MKQRFLEINTGRKKIKSKHWNFEAMCLVDDNRASGKTSPFSMCLDSVFYLFDDIDENIIKKLGNEKLRELCLNVFVWYYQDITECSNALKSMSYTKNDNSRLRQLYRELFKAWGILPDRLEIQKPKHIFYLLLDNTQTDKTEIPSQMQVFYGM